MSHGDLYRSGRISRGEYENAEYLKQSGQKGLYKMYEKSLQKQVKEREKNLKMQEQHRMHILRAEATN